MAQLQKKIPPEELIKWERFERHLREAAGSLSFLHDYAKEQLQIASGLSVKEQYYKKMTDGQLAAEVAHVYHHLNFAWNTRFMSEEVAEADFKKHQLWPKGTMFKEFEKVRKHK